MKYKLGELVNNFDSKRVPLSSMQRQNMDKKYPYYGATGIFDYVDKYIFNDDYILLAEDGTVLRNNKYPVLQRISGKVWVNNHAHILKAKEDIVLQDYLYYVLYITDITPKVTGAVQLKLNQKNMNEIELEIPDLETQKKIVKILSVFDQKIELLDVQNDLLTEIALSIYTKMFSNISSEGGLKNGYIGDGVLTKIVKSGVSEYDGEKKYVATADVLGTRIINHTYVKYDNRPSRANMEPRKETIWFAKMEGSVKNILVAKYCGELMNDYIFSTGFMGIECLNNSLYYIWCYINSSTFLRIKNSLSTGTLMAGVSNATIRNARYVMPSRGMLMNFNKIVEPIFRKIYFNSQQRRALVCERDQLLSRIMSNRIDLEGKECNGI